MTCSIAWFAEHDIDLWLAEEFRVNRLFASRFLDGAGIEGIVSPAYQSRVSVMDDAGRETDVEALFKISTGQTIAVLVENKIKAGFQLNQMADYLERGRRGIKEGKWASFVVVVFAPAYRNMAGASLPDGVRSLTFEDAARLLRFSDASDDRTDYRASFIERAAKVNIISVETENPFATQWWQAVDTMMAREFGQFFIGGRKSIPRTTYVNAKCAGMSPYLRLDLKGSQGQVDLNFSNCSKQKLEQLVRSTTKPDDFEIVEYEKAAALQIKNLEKFQISDGVDVIDTRVRSSYKAGQDLLMFWQSNKQLFDDAMTNSP